MWSLDEELFLREDLIEKVISSANDGDGMLSRAELGNFAYADQIVRVIDPQGGIWNPGASWSLGVFGLNLRVAQMRKVNQLSLECQLKTQQHSSSSSHHT